ncbi:MAG: TRAP transporter substrate-binding protein DctP [Hyphomicrobiaceae bacterium]|nr:TRAP transporter substrate-binding protein DctP [Hyphomicrobiaceae bacterium]
MKTCAAGAALAIAACCLSPAQSHAQSADGPTIEWKHSNWGKRRANTEFIEKLNEIVKAKSGGKFSIKIGYGEVFSKDKENLDSIKLGAIDTADICNFYHPGKNPAWMVFSLPFLPFGTLEQHYAAASAVMKHPALVKDLDRWDATALAFNVLPPYEFMGKGKPPKTLEDWKGLRIRAPGAVGEAFATLGAVQSTVPAVELYTAIERGTVDAGSFPFTYAHAAYQLHTISAWYTANLSPGNAGCFTAMAKASFAKLPPAYQKALLEGVPEAAKTMIAAYREADKKNLPVFKAKLTEIVYSDADLKKFREKAAKPIWDKWVATNQSKFDAKDVLDTMLKEIEKAKATAK